MILTVPITGKLISYDPETKKGVGSDDSPVSPLDFNKLLPEGSDFKWESVVYDYESGMVIVEITFAKKVAVTEWDNTKDPPAPLAWKKESDAEFYNRQANTEKIIRDTFDGKSAADLYKITGEAKLEMP